MSQSLTEVELFIINLIERAEQNITNSKQTSLSKMFWDLASIYFEIDNLVGTEYDPYQDESNVYSLVEKLKTCRRRIL